MVSKGKRYDYRAVQNGETWSAEITRRVTSKKSLVSKYQEGFASEAEALEWAQKEMESFLQNLNEKNKQRTIERIPMKSKWDLIAKRPEKSANAAKKPKQP